jgi:hypothetical protein
MSKEDNGTSRAHPVGKRTSVVVDSLEEGELSDGGGGGSGGAALQPQPSASSLS